MTEANQRVVRRILAALLAADAASTSGCLAYRAVSAPVKVAADTVIVTGEVAGATVHAAGKVSVTAIDALATAGGAGIEAAARLAQAGAVTFVSVSNGAVVRVPWREGATVASAGAEARLQLATRGVDIVRGGSIVFSVARLAGEGIRVIAGDVVRVHG